MTTTELYARLNYDDYKEFERQCREFDNIETTHTGMGSNNNQFYHRAFRLRIGSLLLEIQGPTVYQALEEPTRLPLLLEKDEATCTVCQGRGCAHCGGSGKVKRRYEFKRMAFENDTGALPHG